MTTHSIVNCLNFQTKHEFKPLYGKSSNMDVIEFFKHTDHRNLKFTINYLVKQKLREREVELNERRQRLKQFLEEESHKYEEELSLLLKERLQEKEAQRHEWIGLMRLERERTEGEFLELKQKQLQLENAEEVRHIYSRKMLLDSKQVQLYQIEEKKALREKDAQMDHLWLEAMRKYCQKDENQEIVEQKLRKTVADIGKEKNLEYHMEMKMKAQEEARALREDENQDNIRARDLDKKYKKDEEFYEWRKKVYNRDVLERQIHNNAENMEIKRQEERNAQNMENQKIRHAILMDLDHKGAETVRNRAQQMEYLKYIEEEKYLQHEKDKEFDDMLKGTGCLLEQRNKRPYGKTTR